MDINTLEAEICKFVKENLLASSVEFTPQTELSKIGLDSFSMIEIILFLERKFGVELPDEILTPENIKSVSSLSLCALEFSKKN